MQQRQQKLDQMLPHEIKHIFNTKPEIIATVGFLIYDSAHIFCQGEPHKVRA